MNRINFILLKTMQNFSESDAILKQYESQKNNYWQILVELGKKKNEYNELIQNKESDSSSLLREIEVKKGQIIGEKPSIFKPIKSVSNILENKKIDGEIVYLQNNLSNIKSDIDRLKTLLKNNEGIIHDTSKHFDRIIANIDSVRAQKRSGFEIFDGKWVSAKEIPRLQEIKIGLANNFANMSPFDFEYFVARLLQEMGYKTDVTKKTGDFGTDIIAKKGNKITAVQCKRHNEKHLVGNKLIQQLLGSMNFYHATQCIFVTTSYYTKPAIKQAQNAPIELWDKDTFHELVKKHLLNLNIDQIFTAIEKEKQKEKEKLEAKQNKAIERKRTEKICPICGGGKMKGRKYCSKCKKENQRNRRYSDW